LIPFSFADTLNGRPKINYSTDFEASKSSPKKSAIKDIDECQNHGQNHVGNPQEWVWV
jgi:hypothetical protein